MNDSVVITGTGLVSALGLDSLKTWEALLSGKQGIHQISDFDACGFECHAAAQVHDLNPSMLDIHPRDARIMDKHSFMLLKCAHDAYKQSKLDSASVASEDIGFFAGMGMVDYNISDLLPSVKTSMTPEGDLNYDAFFSQGYREIYPLWPLSMLNNISFCQIAIRLNMRGENTVYSPHADSGAQAIAEALQTVLEKRARVALAGGVSEKVSPLSMARAHLHGILYTTKDNTKVTCRPFSAERKGTILGEGCGILALELRSSAENRSAPFSTMITGYGYAFGKEDDLFCPTSHSIADAMSSALQRAGMTPSDIDVIIAHGDGTPCGDRNEIDAIHQVFEGSLDNLRAFSSKGALGNLFAGAPAVDVILGISMIEHGMIPATLHCLPLDQDIGFHLVTGEPMKTEIKRVMINALSYEGQCASLILESVQ
jgi:3-oxoacyl-[acyl-carrier-protein] synthase II